jgi:Xaa-Pro aminopeptidase
MNINERIEKLRQLMKKNSIDAYIIPSSDAHMSEYVAEYYKCRQWISGFTGSAGVIVVTMEDSGLWTDGRYYIQAEQELRNTEIKLFKMMEPGIPSTIEWLLAVLGNGNTVGIDGNIFSVNLFREMEAQLKVNNISLETDYDLIGQLWVDRPEFPESLIYVHEVKYCGKSRTEKLISIREEMVSRGANNYLLSSLDDIAWTLNIRGDDVPNNPVVISNLLITNNKCYLFVNQTKVPADVKSELEAEGIIIKDYNQISKAVQELSFNDIIILDPDKINVYLYNSINKAAKKIERPNLTSILKAVKNETEIENLKNCEIMDGVAMVKFIRWLKQSVGKESISEITANDKLTLLRKELKYFVGPSFNSIIGYKEHAAMMHYKAEEGNEYILKPEGFLLVDSGGQYFTGTTDTTRTIVLGSLTEEEKIDFTLVLKSYIALDTLKFLYGSTGSNLDVIARRPMWDMGIDYKCGTGHGVGFFLNVHEGPHRISPILNETKLEKGMVITNEPGIYKVGRHGIRTENMMLVNYHEKTEFGQFMKFEAITYCPIDLAGLKLEMLTDNEKSWLNNYHNEVFLKLSPYLKAEEVQWLKIETRRI